MGSQKQQSMLDELQNQCELHYLSDLHASQYADRVADVIAHTTLDAYSLAEWNETARYISLSKVAFFEAETAQKFILNVLAKTKAEE